MLDRKFVLNNIDLIRRNIAERRSRPVDLSLLVELEEQYAEKVQELQQLRTDANAAAKKRSAEASEKGRSLRDRERVLRDEVAMVRGRADDLLRAIPNITHTDVPIGGEKDSKVIAVSDSVPRTFDFEPKDHVDLASNLGLLDLAAGSKVAGPGFYFLQGEAVLLEFALQRMVLDRLIAAGFFPQIVPEMARDEIMSGVGYAPRGDESNSYHIEHDDLNLIATSEVALCGRYSGEIIPADRLPLKLCGISHCFRTERSYGRATRGLFRVHQFTKVEMVILCLPVDSERMHAELLDIERSIFDDLKLPYHVLDIASGDLGAPAYRKFDIEAWMPGRGDGGQFSEVTSASNCLDYQARRLNIRYQEQGEKRREYVHTLNATAIAVGRAMIAIFENYQLADGTIAVPEVLWPYFGGLTRLTGESIRQPG